MPVPIGIWQWICRKRLISFHFVLFAILPANRLGTLISKHSKGSKDMSLSGKNNASFPARSQSFGKIQMSLSVGAHLSLCALKGSCTAAYNIRPSLDPEVCLMFASSFLSSSVLERVCCLWLLFTIFIWPSCPFQPSEEGVHVALKRDSIWSCWLEHYNNNNNNNISNDDNTNTNSEHLPLPETPIAKGRLSSVNILGAVLGCVSTLVVLLGVTFIGMRVRCSTRSILTLGSQSSSSQSNNRHGSEITHLRVGNSHESAATPGIEAMKDLSLASTSSLSRRDSSSERGSKFKATALSSKATSKTASSTTTTTRTTPYGEGDLGQDLSLTSPGSNLADFQHLQCECMERQDVEILPTWVWFWSIALCW